MIRLPWTRGPRAAITAPIEDQPRLEAVEVRPLAYGGDALAWEVVMVFDRKELTLGLMDSEQRANDLAAEIKEGLLP